MSRDSSQSRLLDQVVPFTFPVREETPSRKPSDARKLRAFVDSLQRAGRSAPRVLPAELPENSARRNNGTLALIQQAKQEHDSYAKIEETAG